MKQRLTQWFGCLAAILLLAMLAGCSTNPVTGKQELVLVSESQERELGRKNYAATREAQGGDYAADPRLVDYVRGVGMRLARVADRQLDYEFNIVNDGTPNAWAMPGGKIAVNRGLLLELGSEAELAAVLGHEIVHSAARHSAQSMERGLLIQGAILAAGVALGDSNYRGAALAGATVGAGLATQYYSRDAESEADHYGIKYMVRAGYDPRAAIALQETFVRLAANKEPGWIDGLFASHPPSQERVEANRRQVAGMQSPGGEIGRERYQQAIARLKRAKPAYEVYDKAVQEVAKGNLQHALQLLQQAKKIEPREQLFVTLEQEIQEKQRKARRN